MRTGDLPVTDAPGAALAVGTSEPGAPVVAIDKAPHDINPTDALTPPCFVWLTRRGNTPTAFTTPLDFEPVPFKRRLCYEMPRSRFHGLSELEQTRAARDYVSSFLGDAWFSDVIVTAWLQLQTTAQATQRGVFGDWNWPGPLVVEVSEPSRVYFDDKLVARSCVARDDHPRTQDCSLVLERRVDRHAVEDSRRFRSTVGVRQHDAG